MPIPARGEPVAVPKAASRVPRDLLGSARYDLPVEANRWVAAEMDFLVGQRSQVIAGWLERWDFYRDYVARVFRAHGLPADLQHLGMVESGYVPTARSRVGALGMWQFMPATGREMGLRIDSLVDERMDPVRSTVAAARHLRALHRSFGDWPLAAAAYNAGARRVREATERAGSRNFWNLVEAGYLAQESRTYVPRLYAVTIIGHDPARWGFPAPAPDAPRFAYDSVRTNVATPLVELAQMAGVTGGELARLNPHLVRGTTPPGAYWVWVPAGTGRLAQEAFRASEFRRGGGLAPYRVRAGDDLATLALFTDMDAERLRSLNPGVDLNTLRVGQRVLVPADAARVLAARPAPQLAHVEHVVGTGDTLFGLARRYDTSVDAIRGANRLDDDAIVVGQTLVIPR